MLPMCTDIGVGCVLYSPLSKGRLARLWGQHTRRGDTDRVATSFDLDVDQPVVEAVQQIAEERDVPVAQIALSWVLSKPVVTAPDRRRHQAHHLAHAAAALEIQLTEEEIRRLEEPTCDSTCLLVADQRAR
jgi:aryl-alcohol dehydrogenase-like predicted oxidoreductase